MNHEDVEDEIDIDGDDEVAFGRAQFTEVDVLSVSRSVSASKESETVVEIEDATGPSSDSQPVSRLHRRHHLVSS